MRAPAATLSWRTAARIAGRELRSAVGRFVFVVVAVGLGVGALTGVRSFSQSFRQLLLQRARTLIAGDIELRVPATLTPSQEQVLERLSHANVASTRITESLSMVGSGVADASATPVLSSLKAVDPRLYPMAGSVVSQPPDRMRGLGDAQVLASRDLLLRLGREPGQRLSIGGQPFTIAGVLVSEPDVLAGNLSLGPRLLLSQAGLRRTGIIQFGSQVRSRLVFHLGPGAASLDVVEAELRQAFPHSDLQDYRHANPVVERGLEHATTFLSLISLMALVVGALGVASAMAAHLQLRLDGIATMKVLGARQAQIFRIYGLQTLALGVAGGAAGVGFSLLVARAFPRLLAPVFPNLPQLGLHAGPVVEGLAAGILITLLFTLPTLAGLRRVRPALILRRHMQEGDALLAAGWAERAAWSLGLGAGVAALATALTDAPWRTSLRFGAYFLLALAVASALLALVCWLLLRGLRGVLWLWTRSERRSPPLALRHGLANLYRPGSQARTVMLVLGLGVMFSLSVFLLQRGLLRDLRLAMPSGVPNVFLFDIPPGQAPALQQVLAQEPGRQGEAEILGTVRARLENHGGRREIALASFATLPPGTTLTSGRWPPADHSASQVAVEQALARRAGLRLGDQLELNSGGKRIQATVAAMYRADPARLVAQVGAIASPGLLHGLPQRINGGVRMAPAAIPGLERDLYARFPTVSVLNLADVMDLLQRVMDQIALVVHFVAFFAILAGAIILASSVAGTRFRRLREIAVLKTLGATRACVLRIFSTEFLLLGLVAGAAGCGLALGFTQLVTQRLLQVPYHLDWRAAAIAIAGTAALALAAGWLASARVLSRKPLEVLRSE